MVFLLDYTATLNLPYHFDSLLFIPFTIHRITPCLVEIIIGDTFIIAHYLIKDNNIV